MKPWVRNILITVAVIVLLILSAAIAVSQLYGGKLKEILISRLNNELLTKVEIKGDVQISLWKNFPDASLLAENVVIHGSAPFSGKKVLEAKKVYFLMSFYDLIKQQWNIQSVIIENGNLNLYKDRQGKINFKFVDDKKETATDEFFSLNINSAKLKNVDVYFNDESADALLDFKIETALLKGNFQKETLDFDVVLDSKVKQITLKGENYISDRKVSISGNLKIDTGKNQYRVKTDYIKVQNNDFTLEGLLAFPGKGTKLDLHITASDAPLDDMLRLIPAKYFPAMDELNLNGLVNADITLSGEFDNKHNPFVNVRIDLKQGSFKINAINANAKDIAAIVMFNNGSEKNNRTSSLTIEKIAGKIADEAISGKVILKNLDDPNLHVEYSGNLDLSLMQPFLLNASITSVQGILNVKNLLLKTNLNRIVRLENAEDLMIQTTFAAQNVSMVIDNETFLIEKGDFTANYKTINIANARLKGLKSDIQADIQLDNWKQFLFALGHPEMSASNQLIINADVHADKFDWSVWQQYFKKTEADKQLSSSTPSKYNRNQASNLGGKAKVKIDDVTFNDFKADKLSAELTFTPNQIFLHNGTFNAADGDADTKGYFAFKDRQLEINFSLIARNADMKKIFSGFNNFNQTVITDKNIEGKLTADIKFSSVWNSGVFDDNSLYTYADIKIEDGKLLNFKPLESLSKFIQLDELRNIRFGTLKNIIEIKNQTINIPKMLIVSSALSLSASGTQSFNGNIDYHVKLNLFDVLGSKFGKKKQQFEFEEVDESNFNLFLNISGTTEKPIVKYDRSGMKEKFKQQKEEFKQIREGTKPYTKAKESKDWETKEELEYIEWD